MRFRLFFLSLLLVSCAPKPARDTAVDGPVWMQNLALAREGRLAEDAFTLNQDGVVGLLPGWDKAEKLGGDLAQIYYEAGHIALAQRMAFETDVCKEIGHNAEMIRLLVKTNLIYGEWKVAEKYIRFLEKDGQYRTWAESQRRFVGNIAAVEADPEYGPKRRCLPEDFPSDYRGLEKDLEDIARANPDHLNTLEYLGLYYLLDGSLPALDSFAELMRHFYGPESGRTIPRSFAEACCLLSVHSKNFWHTIGVPKEVNKSFNEFLNSKDKGASLEKFKDSYWYYYFVKLGNIRKSCYRLCWHSSRLPARLPS